MGRDFYLFFTTGVTIPRFRGKEWVLSPPSLKGGANQVREENSDKGAAPEAE